MPRTTAASRAVWELRLRMAELEGLGVSLLQTTARARKTKKPNLNGQASSPPDPAANSLNGEGA